MSGRHEEALCKLGGRRSGDTDLRGAGVRVGAQPLRLSGVLGPASELLHAHTLHRAALTETALQSEKSLNTQPRRVAPSCWIRR